MLSFFFVNATDIPVIHRMWEVSPNMTIPVHHDGAAILIL